MRWLAFASLAGCVAPGGDVACTDEYRIFGAQIVDGSGTPIAGLAKRTIRLADGADVTPRDTEQSRGWYVVLSDGDTSFLNERFERFRFDATGPQGAASFQFDARADCRHIDVDSPVEGALVLQ